MKYKKNAGFWKGENSLWMETGFKVTKALRANDIGVLVTFEDLNPEISISTVFNRKELFQLSLFFLKAIFTKENRRKRMNLRLYQ